MFKSPISISTLTQHKLLMSLYLFVVFVLSPTQNANNPCLHKQLLHDLKCQRSQYMAFMLGEGKITDEIRCNKLKCSKWILDTCHGYMVDE